MESERRKTCYYSVDTMETYIFMYLTFIHLIEISKKIMQTYDEF